MNWPSKQSDQELNEEILFHLEMETEKNRRAGMSERDARRAAKRSFGGVFRVQEEVREQRVLHALELFVRDVQYACRTLRYAPAYALTTIITLALSIGVCAAILTFIGAALLRPLPYHQAERVMTIWERNLASGEDQLDVSPANYLDWEKRATAFDKLALAAPHGFDVRRGDRVVSVPAGRVSLHYFGVLGVKAIAGRTFEGSDYDPGAEPRVVLSESFWREAFNGNRALIGRTIEVDSKPAIVLGVVPDGVDATASFDIYAPLFLYPGEKTSRTGHWMYAVGRLRNGVTEEEASADLDRVAESIARENPATNERLRTRLIPLREALLGRTQRLLIALGAASACLLLLACANIAALSLARGAARRRELAIRTAVGARPSRIVRQLVTEAALLNAVGGVAAYAIAFGIIRWVSANTPSGLRRLDEAHAGLFTIAVLIMVTIFSTVLSGALPAMRLARLGLGGDLEGSRRDSGSARHERSLQNALVVVQIALALLLLTGAGLLTRSLQKLTANDLGFDGRNVATMQMYLYDLHPDPAERVQFIRTSLEAMRALPGAVNAGLTTSLPFNPATSARDDFEIVGRPRRAGESMVMRTTAVSPGFFDTMRIPMVAGRDFTELDGPKSQLVAIVNQAAVKRFWSGSSPLGAKVRIGIMGAPREWTIVGVVRDTRDSNYAEEPVAQLFVPIPQGGRHNGGVTYVVRASAAPRATLDSMQKLIWRLTPSQTIVEAELMDRIVRRSLQTQEFALLVISGFGLVALLLSSAGLYGLLTYVATRRRFEIGVRLALGATPRRIERLFVRRGLVLAAAGIAAGLLLSISFTRVLSSFLYETSSFDHVAIGGVVATTALVTFLASWIPARRVASLQPSSVLRGE